jgi:hypothetical protein
LSQCSPDDASDGPGLLQPVETLVVPEQRHAADDWSSEDLQLDLPDVVGGADDEVDLPIVGSTVEIGEDARGHAEIDQVVPQAGGLG